MRCCVRVGTVPRGECRSYLHGAAGDVCANGIGEYGMTPSDMIAALPQVTKKYNNASGKPFSKMHGILLIPFLTQLRCKP